MRGWDRRALQLMQEAGLSEISPDHRFYPKALWQQMENTPATARVARVAKQIAGTDLECSASEALQIIRDAGLTLKPGAEGAFERAYEATQKRAQRFENGEALKAHLALQICEATVPETFQKRGR
jgi:hypothetical protein